MLSTTSRTLTYSTAALYALLGLALFVMPEQLAPRFAWKVSPFVTMTIGAWCLGNAWLAWLTARRWQWPLVHTTLIYLWLFGILETAVLIAFRNNIQLAHPIAWFYLGTLVVNTLTAFSGVADWFRMRPSSASAGPTVETLLWGLILAFVVFVSFLGIYGLFVPLGSVGTNGGIFPEVMSAFTLRSFAAFYLSLGLCAIPLARLRNKDVLLHHAYAFYPMVIIITLATFAYIGLFNLSERPGGMIYIGAYVLVAIAAGMLLLQNRAALRP
jgi:hypothetical protein